MKKYIIVATVCLCLFLNLIVVKANAEDCRKFTEGIYKATELELSKNQVYDMVNLSKTEEGYITILDENLITVGAVRLEPYSPQVATPPIKPSYRLVIVGKGEICISPKVQ